MLDNDVDIVIIEKILGGDLSSEEILYNKYKKNVTAFLRGKYPNNPNVDDDVSEIMIKIFTGLKYYDVNKSKFKTWVYCLAKNYMIDKWRNPSSNNNSYKTSSLDTSDVNYLNFVDNTDYSDSIVTDFETSNSVNYIATQISSTDFTFLNMKYVQGYNYNEIGMEFNVTSSTVSNRVNYIKTKLKKMNKEYVE